MAQRSPWWYRFRGGVMGAIYVAAFFGTAWSGGSVIAFAPRPLLALGTLLVVAGWAIRVWGSSYLSARVVWNPDAKTNALLVDGPFRYVRNPLYLGNAFFALGIGLLASPLGLVVIIAGHAVFLPMLMRHEATGLRARYGAAYDAYARAVPAFVPRLTPAQVSGSITGTPSLAQGLRSEILSAALIAGMIGMWFAGPHAAAIFIALWLGGWILQRLVTPRLPAESA